MVITGTPINLSLLEGRLILEALRMDLQVAIERMRVGRSARSQIVIGMSGVGKTKLLNQLLFDAQALCAQTIFIRPCEGGSLTSVLALQLETVLSELRLSEGASAASIQALKALSGFTQSMKHTYQDIHVVHSEKPEPGLADNGCLEQDLSELLALVGVAAKAANTVLVIFLDDMNFLAEVELSALIAAIHKTSQRALPVLLIGAGKPALRKRTANLKPYVERLIIFREIGTLK